MNEITRLFILLLTNAGGEGKTALAVLIHTLLELMGEPVAVLDSDAGNYSAALQLGRANAEVRTLSWSVGRAKADQIASDHAGKHVVFDTGANQSASHREVVELLPELREAFLGRGYRTVALLPLSTNKVGAAGALKELAPKIGQFEQVFVRVDRDGSNTFVDDTLDDTRAVRLRHLAPGYQAYVRQAGGLLRAVTAPAAGYSRAADHIAGWMRDFAAQALMVDILGQSAMTAIDKLGRRPPLVSRVFARTIQDVSDHELESRADITKLLDALVAGHWSAATFRRIADQIDAGIL